jgi:hypothetical protein
MTAPVRAYLNHGRWIAGCGRQYCANAERLEPRQALFHCSSCRWEALVEWPPDVDEIQAVLEMRPVPETRNWFPAGHELALRSGCPHGQTAVDLLAENYEYGIM